MALTDQLPLDLSTGLLILISTLSIYWVWTKTRRSYMKYNIPPFPETPRPFVGNLLSLIGDVRDKIEEWNQKVGDIFSLDVAGQHNIVISGYDVIKEVIVKHADYIPNSPKTLAEDILHEANKGIIAARDENWKEQRTVSLGILRDFGVGKNIMAQKIREEVAVYIDLLAASKGQPQDVRTLTNISVSNIICAIIIGKRFEHDDPYFKRFVLMMNNFIKYAPTTFLLSAFPFLLYLPVDVLHIKQFANETQELNNMFAKFYIDKYKKTLKMDEEPRNFIEAYLQEMTRRKENGQTTLLDEDNLVAIIRLFFIAGSETTSTTILWCIVYMLHYPDIQEKVYQEIVEHVGRDRVPDMSDKPKLKYLNAVIMETQRMSSLVPISIRREVSTTFEIKGYTFPKGSVIWPVLSSVLHDKKIWGDPEKFRPERFLQKDELAEHLIPFGLGRRVCLGEALARMELFLFLSAMFQRFRFERQDKSVQLPSLKGDFGATICPQPFQVRFIERND